MPENVVVPAPVAESTQPKQSAQSKQPPKTAETVPEPVDHKAKWKETLKDAPWKLKHKGQEKSLAELDPEELVSYAQRGFGASKLVEEANKTRAEADKVLAAKKALAEGDDDAALEALMELGGKRAVELLSKAQQRNTQREDALKDVPPEVRQLIEQNEAMSKQLAEAKRAQQAQEQERARQAEAEVLKRTRAEAEEIGGQVLKALNLPPEALGHMVPHVARAMREVLEVGQELGVDVGPEQIVERARELAHTSVFGVLDSIPQDKLFEALGMERVAKLARELTVRHRQARPSAAATTKPRAEEKQSASVFALGDPRYLRR